MINYVDCILWSKRGKCMHLDKLKPLFSWPRCVYSDPFVAGCRKQMSVKLKVNRVKFGRDVV